MSTAPGLSEHYATLGLTNEATAEEVRQAYRDLAKIWHPDRFGEEDTRLRKKAEEKLKQINIAYGHIEKTQPQPTQETGAAIDKVPLRNAVLELQLFITTTTVKITTLQIKMVTDFKIKGFKSKEENDSAVQECSALCKEGVSRLKAVLRRIELEAPEYSQKIELERSLAQLVEVQAEFEGFAPVSATLNQTMSASMKPIEQPRRIESQRPDGFEIRGVEKVSAQSRSQPVTPSDIKAAPQSESVESATPDIDNRVVSVTPATSTPSFGNYTQARSGRYPLFWIGGILCCGVLIFIGVVIGRGTSASEQPATSISSSPEPVSQAAVQPVREAPAISKPSPAPAPIDLSQPMTSATPPSDDEASIQGAVEGWANAFRARSADRLADYYAPVVEQYFRKKDVSRSRIQDDFLSAFGKMDSIYAYNISDLRVEFPVGEASPARATATYDKTWDTSRIDRKRNSGEEIERLTFEKTDGGWKIVREDELQVIRSSRQ